MTGGKKELLEINCHKTSKIKKSIKWLKVKMEDVTQKVEQKNQSENTKNKNPS